MAPQYIFTMKDLRKITPQGKEILKGIWLSLLSRGQDRRAGRQRRRQEHACSASWPARTRTSRARPLPPRARRSASCPRSRSSTPGKTVVQVRGGGGRRAARRSWPATRSSRPTGRTRTPTSWAACRTRSTPRTSGSWTATSRWPWTRCACPRRTPTSTTLSGGEKRRVALCRLLLQPNDMLLLDEPTNHLDAESVAWLERFLKEFKGTVVAVTHDRYFLDNVAGWILELDRGAGIPWEGNYSSWLEQKKNRLAQEEKEERRRRRTLERELEWVRMAPRARQAKGKARLTHYEELLAEEQAAEKRDGRRRDHDPARAAPGRPRHRGQGRPQGATATTCSWTTSASSCPRGGIVGVIGPNGAGKTTLFRMIIGQEKPDAGDAARSARRVVAVVRRPEPRHPGRQPHASGRRSRTAARTRDGRQARGELARLRRLVQLPGPRPAEEGEGPLRRRAQPPAPGQAAQERRQPAAARRAHQRPRRGHAARAGGGAGRASPAARWSSATTAGSWTASPPTSSPSRATAASSGSRATTRTTRPTGTAAWGPRRTSRTASSTASSRTDPGRRHRRLQPRARGA